MKRFLFLFTLFAGLLFASGVSAQNAGYDSDTLTNADTLYVYPGGAATAAQAKKFTRLGNLEVFMVYDSLSGATAGTALLQYAFENDPAVWYTKTTVTLNGPTQGTSLTEDSDFGALSWRIRVITSGTQSTRFRHWWRFKPTTGS